MHNHLSEEQRNLCYKVFHGTNYYYLPYEAFANLSLDFELRAMEAQKNPYMVGRLVHFSKLWVLDLYEILRTLKEHLEGFSHSSTHNSLYEPFMILEGLRIRLAKYELHKDMKLKHSVYYSPPNENHTSKLIEYNKENKYNFLIPAIVSIPYKDNWRLGWNFQFWNGQTNQYHDMTISREEISDLFINAYKNIK